jgi:hypothetical protein
MDFGVGSFGGIDNLSRTLIEHAVVVGFHANADDFLGWPCHGLLH